MREIETETIESKVKNPEREKTLALVREALARKAYIKSGLVYGSSLLKWQDTPDVDTAIIVDSIDGVVPEEIYRDLKVTRRDLCEQTGCDIDLITHTEDETHDISSPLYNARYYPSIRHGIMVKGQFPIPTNPAVYQDAAAYVMHDNRTITRRQVLRVNGEGNWGIFLSKLHHGPGNAMTYLFNHGQVRTLGNPSDVPDSFERYDNFFGTNSSDVQKQIADGRTKLKSGSFDFEDGVKLLNWYEDLFTKTLNHGKS